MLQLSFWTNAPLLREVLQVRSDGLGTNKSYPANGDRSVFHQTLRTARVQERRDQAHYQWLDVLMELWICQQSGY